MSDLGPWGYVLFAAVYVAAEVLAVPAMPLTGNVVKETDTGVDVGAPATQHTQGLVMLSSVPHSGRLNSIWCHVICSVLRIPLWGGKWDHGGVDQCHDSRCPQLPDWTYTAAVHG